MPSPTQVALTPGDVAGYVTDAFGSTVTVRSCAPLSGGGFAAVWRVALSDGREVVLKVGPDPQTRLLRYERGMLAAEARVLRRAAGVLPVAPVLAADDRWLFTGLLPGEPLDRAEDTATAREDLGAVIAGLHRIGGDRFGYDAGRTGGSTWPDAFGAIVEDLLADAVDWAVDLPVPAPTIRALLDRHHDALARVRRPALLWFDLWDGNALVAPDPDGRLRLTGLVDGERYLHGDPLFDFVSPLLNFAGPRPWHAVDGHPFTRGYGAVEHDARRLALYQLHLLLVMTVEAPSRGITRAGSPRRYAWLDAAWDEMRRFIG